jgi:hypothetical protein
MAKQKKRDNKMAKRELTPYYVVGSCCLIFRFLCNVF